MRRKHTADALNPVQRQWRRLAFGQSTSGNEQNQ
jgi:hypothetical protein